MKGSSGEKQGREGKTIVSSSEIRPRVNVDSLLHLLEYADTYRRKAVSEKDAEQPITYWRWREPSVGRMPGIWYERGWYDEGAFKGHEWEKFEHLGLAMEKIRFGTLPYRIFEIHEMGRILRQGENLEKAGRGWKTSWIKGTAFLPLNEFDDSMFLTFSSFSEVSRSGGRKELIAREQGEKFLHDQMGKEITPRVIVPGKDSGIAVRVYPREVGYVLEQGKDVFASPAGTAWFDAAWKVE